MGGYTRLIVPQGLFEKEVFQTAFLCQIVDAMGQGLNLRSC